MSTFLWVIVPYLCLATFVVGHFWRYRYDKFGWTTRSSQLYEDRLLRLGSPLFHFGMLGVVGGHVIGLLIPESWTDAVGISTETYHVVAVAGGLVAGLMALVGMAILVYRRRTVGPVFSATTVMDKVMYAFLGAAIVLGHVEHDRGLDPLGGWPLRLPRGCLGLVPLVPRLQPRPGADGGCSDRASSCTHSWPSACSRCGPSPGWCTCSRRRWAT